jgi:hypothetical protein
VARTAEVVETARAEVLGAGCFKPKEVDGNIGFWGPPQRTNDRGAIFEIPGEEVRIRGKGFAQAVWQRD